MNECMMLIESVITTVNTFDTEEKGQHAVTNGSTECVSSSPMSLCRRNSLASRAQSSGLSSRRPMRGALMLLRFTRRSTLLAASFTTMVSPLTTSVTTPLNLSLSFVPAKHAQVVKSVRDLFNHNPTELVTRLCACKANISWRKCTGDYTALRLTSLVTT